VSVSRLFSREVCQSSQVLSRGRRRFSRAACLALILILVPAVASAAEDWLAMLDKLPEAANAVMLADVQALRAYAERRGKADAAGSQAIRDLSAELTPDVQKLAVGAIVDFDRLEPLWELGMFEMQSLPSAGVLARLERGYVDELAGKPVVWSPRGLYYSPLSDHLLATAWPANRQFMTRWLAHMDDADRPLSPYLAKAVRFVSSDVPVVVALDFQNVVAVGPAQKKLAGAKALAESPGAAAEIAKLLGGLQGLVFAAEVKEGVRGTIRLDFDRPPTALVQVGKPLVLEVLERRGAMLPDLENWTPRVAGNSFSLTGPLGPGSLPTLLGFLATPSSVGALEDAAGQGQAASSSASSADKMLAATKKHFDSVNRIVRDVRNFKCKTFGEKALWNDRQARKIDNLPTLDVDDEMIAFGEQVSGLLRGAGVDIRGANISAGMQKSRGGGTTSGWGYDAYGNAYAGTYVINSDVGENRQLAAQARGQGGAAQIDAMAAIDELTGQTRRAMTKKYNVQF
jgi:hypothetical protein